MAHPEEATPQSWDAATFEGNEREQIQRWAKLPFIEKVRWLEQAQRLSLQLQAAREKAQAQGSTNAR